MSTPIAVAFLRRLPVITANCSVLRALPTTACSICMDDFKCQDQLFRLPICHHIFHRNCILPWFSRNNTCPLCRHVFPPEKPKVYAVSVPLTSHILRLRHQLPVSQQSSNTAIRLNFHLRPEEDQSSSSSSSTNSDHPQPIREIRPLEMILLAEGYTELARRAIGPFWISANLTNNVPAPVVGHLQRADRPVTNNLAPVAGHLQRADRPVSNNLP